MNPVSARRTLNHLLVLLGVITFVADGTEMT